MLTCLVHSQLEDVVLELCSSCQLSVFESRDRHAPPKCEELSSTGFLPPIFAR